MKRTKTATWNVDAKARQSGAVMMKTYLINLDRSPERLVFMREQFDGMDIDVERMAGVDGTPDGFEGSPSLAPSEIGCFLSHRRIWEEVAGSEEDYALVLEDDVVLGRDFPATVSSDWIPPTAELIKLDTSGRRVWCERASKTATAGRTIRRLRSEHMGGAGYILSRSCAVRLLDESAAFDCPVDVLMFGKRAVAGPTAEIYQMVPAVVQQAKRAVAGDLPAGLESLLAEERRKREAGEKGSLQDRLVREIRRPAGQLGEALNGVRRGRREERLSVSFF